MRHKINGDARWSIVLDEDDQFEVTGNPEYSLVNYTIRVDLVNNRPVGYGTPVEGLTLHGRRILKNGKESHERKSLPASDGDVPAYIAERASLLRGRVEALLRHIERVSKAAL